MTGLDLQAGAVALLRRSRAILLDFDGPVCAVFAGVGASTVAEQLREVLLRSGCPTGADDVGPHDVLTYAATLGPHAARAVEQALTSAELDAIATAQPTPGVSAFLAACQDTRRPVAIVSNNSRAAITAYLERHELASSVAHIEGRDPDDPARMKPNPWTLTRALNHLNVPASAALFIGDAVTDVDAARAIGMLSIGYANRPAKTTALRDTGADAIVTDMVRLAAAISAAGRLR